MNFGMKRTLKTQSEYEHMAEVRDSKGDDEKNSRHMLADTQNDIDRLTRKLEQLQQRVSKLSNSTP